MNQKTFIVPHDFTNAADVALAHAIATAKIAGASIQLLHVVSNDPEIKQASNKLNEVITKFSDSDIELIPNVRIGNIFDDIADFAAEHQAQLIFMGTHGAHGWQHIVGSDALKIVTQSNVPFIIAIKSASTLTACFTTSLSKLELGKTAEVISIFLSLKNFSANNIFDSN